MNVKKNIIRFRG